MGLTSSQIIRNQCVLELMIREMILTTAAKHPTKAAQALTGVMGWSLLTSGDSVILKKCKETPVKIVEQDRCYADIPVTHYNDSQLFFIDPLTRVVKASSFEIDCSDDALPTFKINTMQYQLKPQLVKMDIIRTLPSRLIAVNRSDWVPGEGLYPSDIIHRMTTPSDHTTRKEEVERQLLKIGSGLFHKRQDSVGVIGNNTTLLV